MTSPTCPALTLPPSVTPNSAAGPAAVFTQAAPSNIHNTLPSHQKWPRTGLSGAVVPNDTPALAPGYQGGELAPDHHGGHPGGGQPGPGHGNGGMASSQPPSHQPPSPHPGPHHC